MECGCTDEQMCEVAQRLYANWQKAGERYNRLATGGNEYALRKAFEASQQHFNPEFKAAPPPRAPGVR